MPTSIVDRIRDLTQQYGVETSSLWIHGALLAVLLYAALGQGYPVLNFPRVGKPLLVTLGLEEPVHERVARGYHEINKRLGKPFVVRWWAKDYVILPPKYLADLHTANDHQVNFFLNLNNALRLHLAAGDLYLRHPNRTVEVVKRGINPQLPRLTIDVAFPEIAHQVTTVLNLPSSNVWTSIPVTGTFMDISNRVATRFMICAELARDEAFAQVSKAFVGSIFTTALIIVKLPLGPLRPLASHIIGYMHRYRLQKCTSLMVPLLREKIAAFEPETKITQHEDAIQWSLSLASDPVKEDPEELAKELMFGLWAASSTPGAMVGDLIFQVLTYPEYLQPLREEAEQVIEEGRWTEKTFNGLRLLDSFIRETNRMHPIGSTTASRTVQGKPWVLSDGLVIPVGTPVSFPIKAIQHDPDFVSSGSEFNGFRFAKTTAKGAQQTASSVDTTNLAFGYGNHVCPGRFFAIRLVKMTFTKLLLEYEFKWDGEVKGRPEPVNVEGQFLPNMDARILLRRRVKAGA